MGETQENWDKNDQNPPLKWYLQLKKKEGVGGSGFGL